MDNYWKAWTLKLNAIALESGIPPARLINWFLKGIDIETDVRFLKAESLTVDQQQKVEAGLTRLLAHEPLSKILEKQEFYGRTFKTTRDTLDPRADSETLIDAMLSYFSADAAPHLLDLGTGTGCLIITLLLALPNATALAVDICPKALAIAHENALQHGVIDRIQFCLSDWCEGVTGVFDGIISNPPYITDDYPLHLNVALYDPKRALFAGEDGLDAYRMLFDQLSRLCHSTTKIVFEIGFDQAESVPFLAASHGYRMIEAQPDTHEIVRALVFEKIQE